MSGKKLAKIIDWCKKQGITSWISLVLSIVALILTGVN